MLLDELNEYRAYARGNLQFEFIDPSGEKGEQDAQQQGIAPVQIQVVKEEKSQVQRALHGDGDPVRGQEGGHPRRPETATLEYEISSTIKRLTLEDAEEDRFPDRPGRTGPERAPAASRNRCASSTSSPTVDVSKGQPVPADIDGARGDGPHEPRSPTRRSSRSTSTSCAAGGWRSCSTRSRRTCSTRTDGRST